MDYTLALLQQLADGLAAQFGSDCEIVIHDLTKEDLNNSVIYIKNGQVSSRQVGDGASRIVWETVQKDPELNQVHEDHNGYLTRTADGRILKSSTMYIKDENGKLHYILSINYDITNLIAIDTSIRSLIETEANKENSEPEQIVHNVNDLLDSLIAQSVANIGKPVALMTKEEKVRAIQFLNDAGAFLITKSGDKVAKYFNISKYTLYSYIDVNKNTSAS